MIFKTTTFYTVSFNFWKGKTKPLINMNNHFHVFDTCNATTNSLTVKKI